MSLLKGEELYEFIFVKGQVASTVKYTKKCSSALNPFVSSGEEWTQKVVALLISQKIHFAHLGYRSTRVYLVAHMAHKLPLDLGPGQWYHAWVDAIEWEFLGTR